MTLLTLDLFLLYGMIGVFTMAILFDLWAETFILRKQAYIAMFMASIFSFFDIVFGISSINPNFRFVILFITCVWIIAVSGYKNPGFIFYGLGGLSNAIVSLANGGRMPVKDCFEITKFHQPLTSATHLRFLGDWILSPGGFFMYSPGDILLDIGIIIFFFHMLFVFIKYLRGHKSDLKK